MNRGGIDEAMIDDHCSMNDEAMIDDHCLMNDDDPN
jgi:hypothetical protein